jgi:acyl-CoA reductase-like NAD-dependent aldehyde dehydrogenase
MALPQIPILRQGRPYQSLDLADVTDHRTGKPLASISQANTGLIRRDLAKMDQAANALRAIPTQKLLDICFKAGDLFLNATLTQTPQQYIESLSATSGLPHNLVKRNMEKIHQVFTNMPKIVKGLTRDLELDILDDGIGTHHDIPVSFYPTTNALGIVLPSNSPGVNSLWMPAIALKTPVVIKPGSEEPWTPWRIIQAFIAAGCPAEAFSYYPTDHTGAASIMELSGRSLIFGDESTIARYAANPAVQVHGPGYSKIIIANDRIEQWQDHIDILAQSVAANSGRSCINASTIIAPKHTKEIAQALAEKLATILPKNPDNDQAQLSAFANEKMADYIDQTIEKDLEIPGAKEVTASLRSGPRKVDFNDSTFLLPTVIHCDSSEHPLANREFLFPFVSLFQLDQDKIIKTIGPSLVATAITDDPKFINDLLRCPLIGRLNLGPIPTTQVDWDQPHEGNLFECLYQRRAIQKSAG